MIPFTRTSYNALRLAAFALPAALFFSACNVSDPKDSNEQETFTTVKLSYVNNADATDKPEATIKFKDGFGHGDALEKNETIKLKAGASYTVSLLLLDETKTPADTISNEVEEEGDEHQLFYTPVAANLTVAYADKDKNNRPIGLKTAQTAGAGGSGTLKVTLRHLVEGNTNLKNDATTITTGETDVEVTFNVAIQ